MSIDFSQHTEREILMNVIPRLEHVEEDVRDQKREWKQALADVRHDIELLEQRQTNQMNTQFGSVQQHLSEQDARLDGLMKIMLTSAISTIFMILMYLVLHALHVL